MKLETEKIQVWSSSGTLLRDIPKSEAENLVKNGKAKILNTQAIKLNPRNGIQKTLSF